MEIRYSKQALKTLVKLDKSTQTRIREGIDGLTQKPPVGDIKIMQGMENSYMIFELVKRCVLAWDPDYTKLTPQEARELEEAKNGEYISANDIDWDNLEKYV